jgi:hypothetical protein
MKPKSPGVENFAFSKTHKFALTIARNCGQHTFLREDGEHVTEQVPNSPRATYLNFARAAATGL